MDGDGSTNFRDLISRTDENGEAMLLKVIKDIFVSCDDDHKGTVEASKLIAFISPFLIGSANALTELKQSLDPENVDPLIDIDTFHVHMDEWTLKVSGSEAVDDIHNVTPNNMNIEDRDLSFSQSTPKSSYGHHLLRGYAESMNVSTCSSYSLTEVPTYLGPDRTVLEDKIHELEHQKRKVAEELNNVRGELAHTVDLNEKLQATLDRTLMKLNGEQKLREQFEREKRIQEEHDEELSGAKKQVVKLERLLATMEKQNSQLKTELTSMQNENQHLDEKITRLSKKNQETLSEIVVLQTELEMRKQQISSAQSTNEKLRHENTELQDIIEQCNCDIDKLKLEKTTLEKFLRESLNKNETLLNKPTRSNSFSEYSPVTKRMFLKGVHGAHNTPQHKTPLDALDSPFTALSKANKVLLEKIKHPISPFGDSPAFSSSLKGRTFSLDKGDSPVFVPEDANASTPTLGMTDDTGTATVVKLGSKGGTPASTGSSGAFSSPPTLYIIDRTRDVPTRDAAGRDQSPNEESARGSDSGEDLAIKLHFMAANTDTNESLQEELSKATSEEECSTEHDCSHRAKWLENEKKLLNLHCDLMQHQSCTFIIEKKTVEVDDLAKENKQHQNNINILVNEIKDLKTQLSLSLDKERLLKERYMALENSFDTSKTYITEVRMKLTEHSDLENKCKDLESKIEALENENSNKYVKIVELTMEVDKLKEGGGGDASKTIEESNDKIQQLTNQKEDIERLKKTLEDRLSLMEEERITLKMDMDKLLIQIINLEEANKDLEHEKSGLQLEKENLRMERENLKMEVDGLRTKNSTIELSIHTFEDDKHRLELEKETFENEMANLKSDNEKLRRELDRFKADNVSSKSSNSTLENEERDLIVVNLRLKLDIMQREKENIDEERQRIADELIFITQERDNLVEEIRRLRKEVKEHQYREDELRESLSKTKEDLSETDSERYQLKDEIDNLRQQVLELTNYQFKCDELKYKLEDTSETIETQRKENGALKHEIQELRKTIEEFDVTYERYQELQERNQRETDLHKREKEELNNTVVKLQTKLEEYSRIEKKQEERLQKSASDVEMTRKSVEDFQRQIKELRNNLENLQLTNEDMCSKLEKANSEVSCFKDENITLEREHEELKRKVQEFEDLNEKCEDMAMVLEKTQKEYGILKVTHEICEQNRKELIQKSTNDLAVLEVEMETLREEKEELTKEKSYLKDDVEKLDHEIRQLKQQLEYFHTEKNESDELKYKLLRENQELSTKLQKDAENTAQQADDLKQVKSENIDLRLKIEKSSEAIALYSARNEKLRATNEELNKLLKKKDSVIEELRHDLDELRHDKENLSDQVEMNKELANTLELSQKTLTEKELYISEIKKENLALKSTKESLSDEIFLLKETCENYKHRIEEVGADVTSHAEKIKKGEHELKEKTRCINKLKKELSTNSKDLDELKSKYEKEIKQKNEELVKKRDVISSLQKKVEANQKELQQTTNNLKEESSKREYMSQKFNEMESSLLDEKNRNNQAKELLAVLESEVNKLRMEEKLNCSTIKLLQQQNSSLDSENKSLKASFKDSNQELLNLVEEKSKLTMQINRLSEDNEDLKEKCKKCSKASEKVMEESQKNISDAFQKMLTAEKKLTETDDDLSHYFKIEIDKYKSENERFKGEIASLVAEKQNIVIRLKSIETENQTARNELEGLLSEKETWLTDRVETRKKESLTDFCQRCSTSDTKLTPRLSNFDKLNIRKEKLEEKVSDLEEKLMQEKESLAEVLSQKIELEEVIKNLNQDNVRLQAEISNLERSLDSYKKQENLSPKSSNQKIIENPGDSCTGDTNKEKEMQEMLIKLEASKIDLITLQEKLRGEEKSRKTLAEQMKLLKDSIANKRFRLERFSLTVMTAWRIPESLGRKLFPPEKICCNSLEVLEPMEKEISRLRDQVDITSNILDYMTKQKSKAAYHEAGTQTDSTQSEDDTEIPEQECQEGEEPKQPRHRRQRSPKFTLRPPTLIVSTKASEGNRIETISIASSGDAGRMPDLSIQLEGTQIQDVDLNEDSNSSKEDDSFDQEASPTLSENALEDMGLLGEDISLQTMSDGDLEQKFNQLVLAFTIDSVSVKTRFSNQGLQLSGRETHLAEQVASCRKALERLLAGESFEAASAHLETVLRQCVRVSMSAVQFGSLKHEVQMVNCVGLMINYAAILQRRLDDMTDRRQSTETPDQSSRQLQIFEVETPNPIKRTVSTQSIGLQVDTDLEPGLVLRPPGIVGNWTYTSMLFWVLFMLVCMLIVFIVFDTDGEFVFITLPWTWTSFDDSLAPFVKKKYIGGPPPT